MRPYKFLKYRFLSRMNGTDIALVNDIGFRISHSFSWPE
jgi:hypothetical protein